MRVAWSFWRANRAGMTKADSLSAQGSPWSQRSVWMPLWMTVQRLKSTMGNFVYETKDFTIANIMASRHLNKDTKIYLGIDNISNHQNFGNYADGNLGRLYRVGMEYKF